MSDPAPHELPSALSSLFESPHHHFLPASGDDESILIDSDLVAAATTDAVAAAAAAASQQDHEHEHGQGGEGDAAAAAAALELSEDGSKRDDEALRFIAAAASASASTPTPPLGKYRPRRAEPSPLDVTLFAMIGENERLRKVVNLLQRPPDETEDVLAEATLRELATAAVGGPIAFGFESLQHQLEQHARNMETIGDNSEFSPSDYAHGLVTQVSGPPEERPPPSDPFLITRLALEDDIAKTRAAIAAKEAEITSVRSGVVSTPLAQPEDRAALEAQLARTNTLIETVGRNASVLRDIYARLQESRDELAADVASKKAEIDDLDDDGTQAEGARALLEVRAYLENAIKLWRDVSLTHISETDSVEGPAPARPDPAASDPP